MAAVQSLPPTLAEGLTQLLEDAERWNAYAARMNAKALAAGIVTAEQLQQDRQASEAALARLRAQLAPTTA